VSEQGLPLLQLPSISFDDDGDDDTVPHGLLSVMVEGSMDKIRR